MKAGQTDLKCGTLIRVTHINSSDPDDKIDEGVVGRITHPFPGHMVGSASKYVAGVWVEKHPDPRMAGCKTMNLCKGDRFEVVEEE
jgi:hypothetical protein